MADDIVEGTSPLQERAEALGEAQTRAVNMSVMDQLKARKEKETVKGEVVMEGTRRGPGRPRRDGPAPGSSEDKAKEEADREKKIRAADARRRLRKGRVDELTQRIVDEGNEFIFSLLIENGIPQEAVYMEGKAPVQIVNQSYTEWGNRIAISRNQAKAVANFLATAEQSDGGAKIAAAMSNSTLGLVVSGLVAGAAVAGYVRNLYKVQQELMPLVTAAKQYKQQMNEQKIAQTQQPTGVQ